MKEFMSSEDFKQLNNFRYTGNTAFDLAVSNGRGLPLGAFIMLYAGRAVGKSTICCDIAKRMIEQGIETDVPCKVLYLDMEGSMGLVENMGLVPYMDSGHFIYNSGTLTVKRLEEIYNDILEGKDSFKDVKLVIIDSLKTLTTESMLKKDVEKSHYGLPQKALSEFLLKRSEEHTSELQSH